jgi:hypothetical protein
MPDDASRALVSAALAGLLCVAANACSSSSDEETVNSALDASAGDASTGGSAGSSSSGGAAGAVVDASSVDVVEDSAPEQDSEPATDASDASDAQTSVEAGVGCDDAGTDAGGVILTSAVVPEMTLEKFTADCDALGGTLELHSHCGGANSCMGMSYDTGTLTFTEHTCKGLNTCAGYSCVVCK